MKTIGKLLLIGIVLSGSGCVQYRMHRIARGFEAGQKDYLRIKEENGKGVSTWRAGYIAGLTQGVLRDVMSGVRPPRRHIGE